MAVSMGGRRRPYRLITGYKIFRNFMDDNRGCKGLIAIFVNHGRTAFVRDLLVFSVLFYVFNWISSLGLYEPLLNWIFLSDEYPYSYSPILVYSIIYYPRRIQ